MDLSWAGLAMAVCVTLCVQRTHAEMCSETDSEAVAARQIGKYGATLEISAEVNSQNPFLSVWDRYIPDQDNSMVKQRIVAYAEEKNQWPVNDSARTYAATFSREANKASYSLSFRKLTCYDRGEYRCTFTTLTGTCVTKFIVNITADPYAPLLRNDSIRGDVGSTVNVLCEANVGYPAGEIWWYYYPADGSNAYRLTTDKPDMSSAGDCRFYAKSTLTMTLKTEDHAATIRCSPRSSSGLLKDFAEAKVIVNGLEITTEPTPKPCLGSLCSSVGKGVETQVRIWPCGLALFLLLSQGIRIYLLT
ncbi:uncharacterized protein LOC135481857 isoform X2 [Liolophura sinensis]